MAAWSIARLVKLAGDSEPQTHRNAHAISDNLPKRSLSVPGKPDVRRGFEVDVSHSYHNPARRVRTHIDEHRAFAIPATTRGCWILHDAWLAAGWA
jgi:hypothetical protein